MDDTPRNGQFDAHHEPFSDRSSSFALENDQVAGPFSFLNPTRAHYAILTRRKKKKKMMMKNVVDGDGLDQGEGKEEEDKGEEGYGNGKVKFRWRSRDNRKGRHALVVFQNRRQGPDEQG